MTRFVNLGAFGLQAAPSKTVARTSSSASKAPARARGALHLWAPEAKISVTAEHQELPKVSRERAGGWRIVQRQGRLAATTWDGSQPLEITLKLVIDGVTGLTAPVSVEPVCDNLRLLGYQVVSIGRPPLITVIGAVAYSDGGVRPDAVSTPPAWVLNGLDFTDQQTLDDGRVSQTVATVTLLEHVDDTVQQQRVSNGFRSYTWQAHDTLSAVAEEELGDDDLAQLIRDANPAVTKSGWSKVQAGDKIRIPKFTVKT